MPEACPNQKRPVNISLHQGSNSFSSFGVYASTDTVQQQLRLMLSVGGLSLIRYFVHDSRHCCIIQKHKRLSTVMCILDQPPMIKPPVQLEVGFLGSVADTPGRYAVDEYCTAAAT